LIAIVAIMTLGWIANNWIRARHGYPVENEWGGVTERKNPDADRKIALLANENEQLIGKLSRLEERLAVLERIATDKESSSARLADSIERLRD